MKVFIGWSGKRSKQAAEVFDKYLPRILDNCETFFSPEMDKEAEWFSEIKRNLNDSDIGIFCITRENRSNEWIHFESGAIAMAFDKSKACPFLLDDLKPSELEDPLVQFEATKNNKGDIRNLIKTISSKSENPMDESDIEYRFEKAWADIESLKF